MAMRETVGSLRAYFIVAALLSAIPSLRSLLAQPFGLGSTLSILAVAFAAAYMYAGIRLKTLLVRSPGQVVGVVLVGGALVIIHLIVSLAVGSMVGVGSAVVELLIVWYLYVNVRRLSAKSAAPPSPA